MCEMTIEEANKILIKCSGNLTQSEEFEKFVTQKCNENKGNYYIVIICGGGSKISAELRKNGYEIKFDEKGRRITDCYEEILIMCGVLEKERLKLQEKFHQDKNIIVIPALLYVGRVICPINGDDLAKTYELGFDEIYIVTKLERVEKKKLKFKDSPKFTIIGL